MINRYKKDINSITAGSFVSWTKTRPNSVKQDALLKTIGT